MAGDGGRGRRAQRRPAPIAGLEIDQIVDHYEQIIRALPSPPIIIGHSFGGAFMQVLLDRGLGAAGVGIASATVKGVLDLPLSTIRATSPVLRNPFGDHKAVPLNEKQFHYAFANTLPQAESDELFRRYHVPAASSVLREGAFANFRRNPPTKVRFDRRRAPLLFIAFGEDHIIPPKASHHNMEKYADSETTVAFKEYPGRPALPGRRGLGGGRGLRARVGAGPRRARHARGGARLTAPATAAPRRGQRPGGHPRCARGQRPGGHHPR